MYISSILQVEVDYIESNEDEALLCELFRTIKVKAQGTTREEKCVEG